MDIGTGSNPKQSAFTHFQFEDWALMSLRFELSLLVHAFKKDVKDPEREGIHEDNIGHYYSKYFRKALSPAFFGLKNVRELLALVSDCIAISDKKVLHTATVHDALTWARKEQRSTYKPRRCWLAQEVRLLAQVLALLLCFKLSGK